jgi:DNA repair protein RadC
LSDSELIALVLRTGSPGQDAWALARTLVESVGGLRALESTPASALEAIRGLGPAKSASLRAAIELGRRWASEPIVRGRPFCGPGDVQRHFEPRLRGLRRESFQSLLLDGRHRLLSIDEVSVGTLTASLVHPREVFREAIRSAAAAILLVHNHPSGDPAPSAEDQAVTRRLQAAGELVGIRVVDHVIVSEGGYYSFRESDPAFEEAAEGAPVALI